MKNKILPILCILILFSFIFINNNVFARDHSITENSLNSILDFVYNNQYYLNGYTNIYIAPAYKTTYAFDVILVPNNATYKYHLRVGDRLDCTVDGNKIAYTSIRYGFNTDGSIVSAFIDSPEIDTSGSQCRALYTTPLYSTFDIYVEGSETEIFFQRTPPIEIPETPETVEIPKLETVEQIPETIVTTLKLIIPVGLVILSTVLVIYLVRRLICRFS